MMGLFCFASCSEDTPDKGSYFTVKFNSMGGTEVKEQKVKAGEKAEKPADPTKDGVVFSGWFKSDKFEKEWIFENETVNSDITLYAKWIAGEKLFIGYEGTLLDDRYVVVNSSYNYPTSIHFNIYNEYGLYSDEPKFKFDYDKDKLNDWLTEPGSIIEEENTIVIHNLKTNLPVGAETAIKATSEVNSNVSKTVVLKTYSADEIKNKFTETVNSFQAVSELTFDNYREIKKKVDLAELLYDNLSEQDRQVQEVQSAYEKLELLRDNDYYDWDCLRAVQIDGKTCSFDSEICQYHSNGDFPLGEITDQYTENGQLKKDQFKFLSGNKFEYWHYSNGEWEKKEAGEYRMAKDENGLQMIIKHSL